MERAGQGNTGDGSMRQVALAGASGRDEWLAAGDWSGVLVAIGNHPCSPKLRFPYLATRTFPLSLRQ